MIRPQAVETVEQISRVPVHVLADIVQNLDIRQILEALRIERLAHLGFLHLFGGKLRFLQIAEIHAFGRVHEYAFDDAPVARHLCHRAAREQIGHAQRVTHVRHGDVAQINARLMVGDRLLSHDHHGAVRRFSGEFVAQLVVQFLEFGIRLQLLGPFR